MCWSCPNHTRLDDPMPTLQSIDEAVALLRQGQLVALPTETVYGLGGDASNPLAIRQIYAAKGRPAGHPVIVHLAASADIEQWATPNNHAEILRDAFWPGPLTMILPKHPRVLAEVTGGGETVGLRMPAHLLTQAILEQLGTGLAAPSANRFGRVSPTTAAHVIDELGPEIHVLDGGPCSIGIESTIVDLSGATPAILRQGSISSAEIQALIGPLGHSNTVAPGTLKRHYSTMTALLISTDVQADQARIEAQGHTVAVLRAAAPQAHARSLYAELRRLDALGVDILIAERASDEGIGQAINDRLTRAAHGFSID